MATWSGLKNENQQVGKSLQRPAAPQKLVFTAPNHRFHRPGPRSPVRARPTRELGRRTARSGGSPRSVAAWGDRSLDRGAKEE